MRFLLFFVTCYFLVLESFAQVNGPGSGNTLVFDGVSTRVNIPDKPSFDHGNNITLEAWIFPTSYGGVIFGKHHTIGTREYTIQLLPDGRIRFDVFDNSSTDYLTYSLSTVPLNSWTHVAGIYSYATASSQIYINGVLDQKTVIGSITIASTNTAPMIGAYWLSPPTVSRSHFIGSIDEVRLWHSVRSQTEIRDNMCRTLVSPQSDLIAYYRLDEANGLSAKDASGNGSDGTLQSFTTSQTNDWNFSGAPIGNESVYNYPGSSWSGLALSLGSIPPGIDEGSLGVDNITGSPEGFHVYRVDDVPSQIGGLDKPLSAYFGTFVVGGISPDYRVIYKYSGTTFENGSCESFSLHQRDDNSVSSWAVLSSASNTSGNTFISDNNSSRKEIILDTFCIVSCPVLPLDLGQDRFYCSNSFSDNLDAVVTGVNYLWSTGALTQTISVSDPGIYWVEISLPGCNYPRDSINLTCYTPPTLGKDTNICSGVNFSLDAGSGWTSYKWSNGDSGRTISVAENGHYYVKVKNDYCIFNSDTVSVNFIINEMYIPNLTTPNGDGKNDGYSIKDLIPHSTLAIYNIWGGLIYKSDEYANEWKPEDYADGIYFYNLESGCGSSTHGWIQILR
jgi:hypothetical protein